MGKDTKIEWADHTFNPWWGCDKISPACDHCYAEKLDARFGGGHWGPHAPRRVMSDKHWRQPLTWDAAAARAGKPARVFCASMADIFDNKAPESERARLWDVIRTTPNLIWMLLTKRPQNIAKMLPPDLVGHPRIWLGVTIENPAEATRRLPVLKEQPAPVRFISAEPLLEFIHLDLTGIGWVICGGESGRGARPMHPAWARSLRDQCTAARVPFFFKQWGDWGPLQPQFSTKRVVYLGADGTRATNPGAWLEPIVHAGKKLTGRALVGRTYDELPAAAVPAPLLELVEAVA